MKKRILILGSTGSIGENTFKIIKKNKKEFEIVLLSTNTNLKKIFKQAKELNVKNVLINDYDKFIEAKSKYKSSKIKIYNTFNCIDVILKNKLVDYSMVSISGLDGLKPTLQLTKYSPVISATSSLAQR